MIKFKMYKLLFLILSILITLIGALGSFFLPEHFMFDAKVIVLDQFNEKGWVGSYPFAMMFYHILSLNKLPYPLIAIIQLPLIFYLLHKLGIPKNFHHLTLRNLITWLGLLVFAIFVGFPSKEFITAIYIFLIARVLILKISLLKKIILSSLMLLFFASFFRQYFLLMPLIAIPLYFISFIRVRNRVFFMVLSGLAVLSLASLSHGIVKGEFVTEKFRQTFNKNRLSDGNKHANTMILSPLDSDTISGEIFGITYGFFSVNLPLNGFKFYKKPQIIAFVLWQLTLIGYLCFLYSKVLSNKKQFKHELWIFNLLFSYFLVQGIFEPDLGSAIKHKLGMFPLLWLAIYHDKLKIGRSQNPKKYVINIGNPI